MAVRPVLQATTAIAALVTAVLLAWLHWTLPTAVWVAVCAAWIVALAWRRNA